MFWVGLASEVYDPNGSVILDSKPDSEISTISRRVSRTATLDGGATLEDLGYSAADATLNLNVKMPSMDLENKIIRLIQIYPILTVATRYGSFRGVVDYFKPGAGSASIRFLVQRQLSA